MKRLAIAVLSFLIFLSVARTSYARCSDTRPVAKPVIYSAQGNATSVTLTWSEVPDPVTYYLVRYGTSKDNLEYGSPDIGGRGANTYTISDLQPGVKYYFQIRAGNGCRPGDFSDTAVATPGTVTSSQLIKKPKNLSMYKKVLGVSTMATQDAQKYSTHGALPKTKEIIVNPEKVCAFRCQGLPFLLVEAAVLLLFFFLAESFASVPPGLSIVIPIVTYILFYMLTGKCGTYNFFCKYFLPLNIILYVLMLVVQKYILIESRKKKI